VIVGLWVAVLVLAVSLGVVVLVLTGVVRTLSELRQMDGMVRSSRHIVEGVGLPVGRKAPPLQGRTLTGERFPSNGGSDREPHVLAFVSPGCSPCERLMDELRETDPLGVRIRTILVTDQPPEEAGALRRWTRAHGGDSVVLEDVHEISSLYETTAKPHVFVVGSDGTIAAQGITHTARGVQELLTRAGLSIGSTSDRDGPESADP
jgi:hypothetical protein